MAFCTNCLTILIRYKIHKCPKAKAYYLQYKNIYTQNMIYCKCNSSDNYDIVADEGSDNNSIILHYIAVQKYVWYTKELEAMYINL